MSNCRVFDQCWMAYTNFNRSLHRNLVIKSVTFIAMLLFIASSASAHVKWFSPYDVVAEPRGIGAVMTPSFYLITGLSILLVFVIAWLDRKMVKANVMIEGYRALLIEKLPRNYEFQMLRNTLLVFFTSIWVIGDVVLTPELKHQSLWIGGLHIVMIASLFTERTARYAGAGIFILWGYSAYHYGFFHLSDYMIFLGIAVFIILSSISPDKHDQAIRYLVLYISISFTLQWASIEKFVYPDWTYPLLERFPHLTMGLTKESFMDLAGASEFLLAFLLIAVSGIGFVSIALFLAAVFIAAIYDFGKVDAIGHIAIIVSLFVMAIHGPAKINTWFSNLHPRPMINALYVTLIYCVSLILFFVIYYLMRKAWLLTTTH